MNTSSQMKSLQQRHRNKGHCCCSLGRHSAASVETPQRSRVVNGLFALCCPFCFDTKSGSVTLNCAESMKCSGSARATHLGRHTICLGEIYLTKKSSTKTCLSPPHGAAFVSFFLQCCSSEGLLGRCKGFFLHQTKLFFCGSAILRVGAHNNMPAALKLELQGPEECLRYVQAQGVCSHGMRLHCRLVARH